MLEAIIESGDRVAIEGDNQKQADFLAAALAKVDPARIHDLHMVQSVLALPDHLAVSNAVSRADWIFRTPDPTGSPNSLPVVVIEKDGDGFSITSDHLTVTAKIPGIDPDTSAAGFELMSETRFFFKHCRKASSLDSVLLVTREQGE